MIKIDHCYVQRKIFNECIDQEDKKTLIIVGKQRGLPASCYATLTSEFYNIRRFSQLQVLSGSRGTLPVKPQQPGITCVFSQIRTGLSY